MTVLHTARLAIRPLCAEDYPAVRELAGDERVMATLGGVRSAAQVRHWLERELAQFSTHGYCRNVVSLRDADESERGREHDSARFIGLVGLTRSDFDAGVVPGIEIAWQLAHRHWGQGFATEAAERMLTEAFTTHGLSDVIAITSVANHRSRRVMERLGMQHSPSETFEHGNLPEGHPLRTHVVYRMSKPVSE